jgi:hypothetical protein
MMTKLNHMQIREPTEIKYRWEMPLICTFPSQKASETFFQLLLLALFSYLQSIYVGCQKFKGRLESFQSQHSQLLCQVGQENI